MLSKCVVLINVSVDDTIAKILRLETRKERRKDTTLHKKKKNKKFETRQTSSTPISGYTRMLIYKRNPSECTGDEIEVGL